MIKVNIFSKETKQYIRKMFDGDSIELIVVKDNCDMGKVRCN
jgi:hypothetical protein